MKANLTNPIPTDPAATPDFPFTLTGRAADAFRQRRSALRVAVVPGGCSGLRYVVTPVAEPDPAEGPDEADIVLQRAGITVLIDRGSAEHVAGAVIDLDDAGFTITNPQSRGACACGASFAPVR